MYQVVSESFKKIMCACISNPQIPKYTVVTVLLEDVIVH